MSRNHLAIALLVVVLACGTVIASPWDTVRKYVEDRTGIRVPVPTPGQVAEGVKKVPGDLVRFGGSVIQESGKVLNNANREVGIFASNVSNEGNKGLENIARESNKGIQNVIRTLDKARSDAEKNIAKAGKDAESNIAKSGRDVEDAAHAIGHYVERSVQGVGKSADRAMDRIREGKFVDAIWHASLDPLQNSEENLALAAQESSLVRTVGQVAATAYGGPQGAAAYAAWLTYKQTGSMDLALKVGLITGVTSAAFSSAGKISTDEDYGLLRKTLVTASVGGAAVAVSGGSADQVREGFLSAGAMVLVQDHYRKVTQNDLDRDSMKSSKELPSYCIGENKTACTPVPKDAILKKENGVVTEVNRAKLDRRIPSVGLEGSGSPIAGDNSIPMKLVSRIPGAQGMSIMHDSWVTTSLPPLLNQPTIVPAIVVYYTGTGAPFYDHLRRTAIERAIEAQAKADRKKAVGVPSEKLNPATFIQPSQLSAPAPDRDAIAASYVCGSGSYNEQLVIEVPMVPSPYVCRTLHQKTSSSAVRVLHKAHNETGYCAKKSVALVKSYLTRGLSCMQLTSSRAAKSPQRVSK